jgi:hypothetical protein
MSLKKICIHWSAGTPTANELDKKHYHFMVEQSGQIVTGYLPPESNIPLNGVSLSGQPDGTYAAHCGGGNSFCIGVSLCGMNGKNPNGSWKFPLNKDQVETACQLIAQLCIIYNITIKPETVFTHYEFGQCNPNTPSAGKIDITALPFAPQLKPAEVGNYLRGRIQAYHKALTASQGKNTVKLTVPKATPITPKTTSTTSKSSNTSKGNGAAPVPR